MGRCPNLLLAGQSPQQKESLNGHVGSLRFAHHHGGSQKKRKGTLTVVIASVHFIASPSESLAFANRPLIMFIYTLNIYKINACADKPVTMRLLKRASVGIIVEGVAGIFHGATLQHERIFLQQRKGFIKCAIQSGVGKTLASTVLRKQSCRNKQCRQRERRR